MTEGNIVFFEPSTPEEFDPAFADYGEGDYVYFFGNETCVIEVNGIKPLAK